MPTAWLATDAASRTMAGSGGRVGTTSGASLRASIRISVHDVKKSCDTMRAIVRSRSAFIVLRLTPRDKRFSVMGSNASIRTCSPSQMS
jgi:hypothetical protein